MLKRFIDPTDIITNSYIVYKGIANTGSAEYSIQTFNSTLRVLFSNGFVNNYILADLDISGYALNVKHHIGIQIETSGVGAATVNAFYFIENGIKLSSSDPRITRSTVGTYTGMGLFGQKLNLGAKVFNPNVGDYIGGIDEWKMCSF